MVLSSSSRFLVCLLDTMLLASFSSSVTINISPAAGTSEKPITSTGVDGPAFLIRRPLSSIIALTRPIAAPAITVSPIFNVPLCTRTDATGPRPLSSSASTTVPLAGRFAFAFSSPISATSRIISNNSLIPCLLIAETFTQIVSPPHSSDTSPCSVNSCFTLSEFAPGLSILLMATIMGTPASLAWFIASTVWGITPSSAATTKMAISVT
ncbi:MAG: hypothetical protein BWY65_01288 [Firmicutes bacterium ADurb.Bin373]|nr:MAG: hypothetical protein BWY65_01288 [Firmicutes bacterium ADurb.Bin373]